MRLAAQAAALLGEPAPRRARARARQRRRSDRGEAPRERAHAPGRPSASCSSAASATPHSASRMRGFPSIRKGLDRNRDRLLQRSVLVLIRVGEGRIGRDLYHVAAAAIADQPDEAPARRIFDAPEVEGSRHHRPSEHRMARPPEERRVHVRQVAIEGLPRALPWRDRAHRERLVAEVDVVRHHEVAARIVREERAQARDLFCLAPRCSRTAT